MGPMGILQSPHKPIRFTPPKTPTRQQSFKLESTTPDSWCVWVASDSGVWVGYFFLMWGFIRGFSVQLRLQQSFTGDRRNQRRL